MLVTYGVDATVFDVIDAHRPRSIGDQLTLVHQVHAGKRIAPATVVIRNIENPRASGHKMTIGLTLEIYERFVAGLEMATGILGSGPFAKAPIIGSLAYGHDADPGKAEEFAYQIRNGEHLSRNDPAYALRNFVINNDGNSSQFDRRSFTQAALRCFYGFHKGQKISVIKPEALDGSEILVEAIRFFKKFHGKPPVAPPTPPALPDQK
jgi:hypothetical protein